MDIRVLVVRVTEIFNWKTRGSRKGHYVEGKKVWSRRIEEEKGRLKEKKRLGVVLWFLK